jgi:non-lysosomal glucosylceramidase
MLHLPLLLAASCVSAAAGRSLYDLLTSAPFLHSGTVLSSDTFTSVGRPCSYLEPENVTVAPAQGIGWTESGSCPLLYSCPTGGNSSTPCAGSCSAGAASAGQDRPGGDYRAFVLPATVNGSACAAQCCAEAACAAWAYAPAAPAGQEPSCTQGSPCCYLKAQVHAASPLPGVFSGLVARGPVALAHPPMGLRSAAPLGGLGAGAFELRADGTVHEVTIVNQSPAGAAKFGVLADMVLGARIGGVARALRTAPPPYAPGVSALTYSALYPLARLAVAEGDFGASATGVAAFAYSRLLPGDPAASAAPAVAFTLALTNSGAQPLNASLYLSLPLASVNDCARPSAAPLLGNLSGLPSPAACLAACAATPGCASWTLAAPPPAGASGGGAACLLAQDAPLSVHSLGAYCGLAGAWSSDGSALTLALPCTGAGSPACGDAVLRPVQGEPGQGSWSASMGAAAEPGQLWQDFAASGGLGGGQGSSRVVGGVFEGAAVGYGAAAVSLTLPPGANATLSLVFAWSFPHRDHAGEDIGNFYSTLWGDSGEVALELAGSGALEEVAGDLAAHHAVFAGPDTSLPPWLGDFLVNGMSHFRGMIWSRDGRMREFEAFDCMDLDSIHNDYQRHLPYLWLMPSYEEQKLRKWGSGQLPSGVIQEFLGPFGVGPFDVPGGRIMGDTTTLWVVELLELWRSTGDGALLADLYPTAQRALQWLMANAAGGGYDLPDRLYSTYDILWLEAYNTTSYNSFLYLAALRAGEALAAAAGDAPTAAAVAAARQRAEAAVQALLWNAEGGYYKAYLYGNESAVMADSLYGAVVAGALGLGALAPPAQMAAHLQAELAHNYDPHGFVSITGRPRPPPDGQRPDDTKLWQQAGPDWSALALQLGVGGPGGGNASAALDPAFRQLDNWRSRLRSLWNLAGLTSAEDAQQPELSALPYCTAHYGFALVAYWLVPSLSGQVLDLPGGTLSFAPTLPCPMQLPVMAAALEGTLQCDGSGRFTLAVAFGTLQLPAGGLSASGRAYAGAVDLGPGEALSW